MRKNNQAGKDGKISISMYMWDRSMFKEFTPWLEQKFPDIEFTFIQSYNTMEYYKDLLTWGEDMPDIITCRRFSLNDAASLSDHLMDLSQTEVAGTFYSSYLEVNREDSGAIRWLPLWNRPERKHILLTFISFHETVNILLWTGRVDIWICGKNFQI